MFRSAGEFGIFVTFVAKNSTLAELWGSAGAKYVVPRYQREYSWSKDNIQEFWKDLHQDTNLFLGSIVLKSSGDDERTEIIDGQQRMLTMTILYAAMRDVLIDLGEHTVALKLHEQSIVQSQDLTQTDVTILPTPGLREFFRRSVQSFDSNFSAPKTPEEKRVVRNYTWFKGEIDAGLKTFEGRATDFLTNLYKKIRNLKIIEIAVDDDYDAYRIFESVNATGVDLTVSDLIKNMIFSNVRPGVDGHDIAETQWGKMRSTLEEINVDIAKFVRYHWISRNDFVTKSELYRDVKRKISTEHQWEDLLEDLLTDSRRLAQVSAGEIPNPKSHKEIQLINDSLSAIEVMGFSQCYVLFLSLLRNRERLNIGWGSFLDVVRLVEEFNFKYHLVCRRPANRVERQYSEWANAIEKIQKFPEERFRSTMHEIKQRLGELLPNKNDFYAEFASRTKYTSSSKRKMLIRYILGAMERKSYGSEFGERPLDPSISIEHILPQTPTPEWNVNENELETYVHDIGNLILVGSNINSGAGNAGLETKLAELRHTAIRSSRDVIESIAAATPLVWSQTEISARTGMIAEFVFDRMWT